MNYFILFENYDQGLALHDLLTANGIDNRIAPTPRSIQGKLSCGMSLLIKPQDVEQARACMAKNQAVFYDIVPLNNQLKARRDTYC